MPAYKTLARRLLPALALVGGAACRDVVSLDEKPPTFVDPSSYFKSDAEAITAANGIYQALMTWDNWINPAWQELTCEGPDVFCPGWYAWGQNGASSGGAWFAGRTWTGNYLVIRRANDVLGQLERPEITAQTKQRLKGEAHFLRGYAYFELVRRYGAVPLRLQPYQSDGTYGDAARAPMADVYKAIVGDLKAATTELPASYAGGGYTTADQGRPVQASAQGLLAKVYLTMAGAELDSLGLNKAAYADSARQMALAVKTGGFAQLEPDFMRVFDWQQQVGSREILWQIGATHLENTGPELPGFFNPADYALAGGGGGGFLSMRTPFYQTYEANDKRVQPGYSIHASWMDGSSATAGSGVRTYFKGAVPADVQQQIANGTQSGWTWTELCDSAGVNRWTVGGAQVGVTPRVFTMKYIDKTAQSKSQNSNNPIILRYADVLLILAEAENEVAGPTAAAYEAIDAVRARAGLPGLRTVKPGLDKAGFREAVWLERRHELFAEFQDWFDLKRQGRWLQVMNNQVAPYPGAADPNSSTCRPRRAFQTLLPLPAAEIGANRKISQNPGY